MHLQNYLVNIENLKNKIIGYIKTYLYLDSEGNEEYGSLFGS